MGAGNDSQSSGLDNPWIHIKTGSIVIYCLIFIVGTLGNGLVIYVTGFKMKKTVDSVWFLNLAIADFLFTAFLIFSIISLSQDHIWPFGNFMCKLNTFVSVVNMFASIFLLTAISVDRCLCIYLVVWAHNKRTVCKAQIICASIWVIAALCSTPYATLRSFDKETEYCYYNNLTHAQRSSLNMFRFAMGFAVPFLVIVVSYVLIGIRAWPMQRTRRRRSRRIIFAIISAFFICWIPFHILNLVELYHNPHTQLFYMFGPMTVCLAFLNSCLNPILYVFLCDEFQKKLKQSIFLVIESALAEDHLTFMSSRSMSKCSQKSDTPTTLEKIDIAFCTEGNAVMTEETMSSE